jgi:hypothetical protein
VKSLRGRARARRGRRRATGRLIKLCQRERRAQLEAPRLLLLGDCDGGEEGFFGWSRVRRIALEQYLAPNAVPARCGSKLIHFRQVSLTRSLTSRRIPDDKGTDLRAAQLATMLVPGKGDLVAKTLKPGVSALP